MGIKSEKTTNTFDRCLKYVERIHYLLIFFFPNFQKEEEWTGKDIHSYARTSVETSKKKHVLTYNISIFHCVWYRTVRR